MPDRSKWEIKVQQLHAAQLQVEALKTELQWAEETPFTANGTGQCSACATPLPTEKDFWDHFLVPDERLLNVGYCPNK